MFPHRRAPCAGEAFPPVLDNRGRSSPPVDMGGSVLGGRQLPHDVRLGRRPDVAVGAAHGHRHGQLHVQAGGPEPNVVRDSGRAATDCAGGGDLKHRGLRVAGAAEACRRRPAPAMAPGRSRAGRGQTRSSRS
eukprot:8965000-Heterocapsa_arctica.AAC.1